MKSPSILLVKNLKTKYLQAIFDNKNLITNPLLTLNENRKKGEVLG